MNAAARSSAFCGIVGGGGDMVRVAASLRWGSSARRLRGRRRSRLDVFCLRSLAYEETLEVHSGLRKRRTGSEDADRRHLRKTSPRLRPLSPRTPARRDLDHRIQRDRQLRRSRPASATMAPPRCGRLAIAGRSPARGRQALCTYATQGRRVRRSWRTVIEVPRRPASERDWPHMPYMPKARCVLLGAAACSYLKNSAAPTTCLLRLASALPYGCRAE